MEQKREVAKLAGQSHRDFHDEKGTRGIDRIVLPIAGQGRNASRRTAGLPARSRRLQSCRDRKNVPVARFGSPTGDLRHCSRSTTTGGDHPVDRQWGDDRRRPPLRSCARFCFVNCGASLEVLVEKTSAQCYSI